jgi:hypothetical protein
VSLIPQAKNHPRSHELPSWLNSLRGTQEIGTVRAEKMASWERPGLEEAGGFEGARVFTLQDIPGDADSATGVLTVVTGQANCPFPIRRVYWLHGSRRGEIRGQHAHRTLSQLMVAIHGSFVVKVHNGFLTREFVLNSPSHGLLLLPGLWRVLETREADSVLLVVASDIYREDDYIRDFDEFLAFRRSPIANARRPPPLHAARDASRRR